MLSIDLSTNFSSILYIFYGTTRLDSFAKLNKSCCSIEDVEDARKVCRQINAKHYFLNFEKEFEQHVINYFVSEYEKGRTPHPCLACNDRLKFDFLLKRSELMDADYLATGHYAQIIRSTKGNRLVKAKDISKDQSYVLFNLNQEKMERLILPVGKYSKDEIREIAKKLNLSVADKPDSQDICFIPSGDYKKFVEPKITKNISGSIINNG
jgi:tRNA-specific 2-thiouridylase